MRERDTPAKVLLGYRCKHPPLQTRSFLPRKRLVSRSLASLCAPHRKHDIVAPMPVRLAVNGLPPFFATYRSPSCAMVDAVGVDFVDIFFVMIGSL